MLLARKVAAIGAVVLVLAAVIVLIWPFGSIRISDFHGFDASYLRLRSRPRQGVSLAVEPSPVLAAGDPQSVIDLRRMIAEALGLIGVCVAAGAFMIARRSTAAANPSG